MSHEPHAQDSAKGSARFVRSRHDESHPALATPPARSSAVELALASFPAEVSGFPGRGRRWADYRSPRPTGNGEISAPRHPTGGRTQHDGRQDEQGGQTAQDGAKSQSRKAAKPALLSGGNPQIAKGYGDAPVQAYIAAMPGWKRDVGRRLDALIVRTVPDVRKAVKWNSPFYGIEGQGWFLGFHCFTKYVKVAFFRGTSLRPVPPGESKHKEVRYLDIHEDDQLDEAQLAAWVQAGQPIARSEAL